jgi:hypothetical protein
MKILFVSAAAAMIVLSSCAIDGHPVAVARSEKNLYKEAQVSFASEFKEATAVSWENENDLSFAHFMLGNERLVAAYDEKGERISVSRFIEYSELPLSVTLNLKERYPGASRLGQVAEVDYNGYAVYYFTIVTPKAVLRLRSNAGGYFTVMERQKIPKQH